MSPINSHAHPLEISMFLVDNYVKRKSYNLRMRESYNSWWETDGNLCFHLYLMGYWVLKWVVNWYAASMTYDLIAILWGKVTGSEHEIFMNMVLSVCLVASSEVASMSLLKAEQHSTWNNECFYWTFYRRWWTTKVTIKPMSDVLNH